MLLSYVDQSRASLDATKTVWEVVSDGLDYINVGRWRSRRALMSQRSGSGSGPAEAREGAVGGERNRLNLALTLKMGGNVLLLDEPTNDLDVETLGSLENALLDFPGCAVITSHDRWFLDRVPRTSWPLRATPSGSGSRATSRATRRTRWIRLGPRPPVPTVPPTAN